MQVVRSLGNEWKLIVVSGLSHGLGFRRYRVSRDGKRRPHSCSARICSGLVRCSVIPGCGSWCARSSDTSVRVWGGRRHHWTLMLHYSWVSFSSDCLLLTSKLSIFNVVKSMMKGYPKDTLRKFRRRRSNFCRGGFIVIWKCFLVFVNGKISLGRRSKTRHDQVNQILQRKIGENALM